MIMPALSVIGEESWSMKDPKLEEMIHQTGGSYPNPNQVGISVMDCSDYNSNIDPSRMNCLNNMDSSRTTLNVQDGKIPIIETEVGKKMVSTQKEVCCGCGQPIQDRYLLRVVDNYWHERCLRCAICATSLTSSCFVKDGQLLCRNDYTRFYGVKCSRCYQSIPANDFVMRAMENIYHLQCFSCVMCGYQLQKGDQFVVKDGQVYCRMDYEKEFMFHIPGEADWFPSYHPNSDGDSIIDDGDGEGGKGPKRPRTILTTSQRRKFKASFEINPKPCRKVREGLAAETGLSVRVVQVWFQNQRAKMKKIARKQQQSKDCQNGKKASPKDNDKDDSDSDSDTESCSHPLNNNKPSNKSTSDSTDLSSEPSASNSSASASGLGGVGVSMVTGLEDVFMNQASQNNHHTSGGLAHLQHGGPVVNPIDKLYSMQSSYFSTD